MWNRKKRNLCTATNKPSFPIVQGSTYPDLRRASGAYAVAEVPSLGYAMGGLSVGEPHEDMYAMCEEVCAILPEDAPRYMMGVGTPVNIFENIALGVDMFDCVMPTRNARTGTFYTWNGIMNMKNAKWKTDTTPLDSKGTSAGGSLVQQGLRRGICFTPMSCWPSTLVQCTTCLSIWTWSVKHESN